MANNPNTGKKPKDGLAVSVEDQVRSQKKGRIFALRELSWNDKGVEEVSFRLRRMRTEGEVSKIRKGEFFVPSSPDGKASREEVVSYLCRKLGGYLSGPLAYHKAGIIHVPPPPSHPVTIAVRKSCRSGEIAGIQFRFVRQYASPRGFPSGLVLLLDTLKDADSLPGLPYLDALDDCKDFIVSKGYSQEDILRCALRYPPRVRRRLHEIGAIPLEYVTDVPGKGAWRKEEYGLNTKA